MVVLGEILVPDMAGGIRMLLVGLPGRHPHPAHDVEQHSAGEDGDDRQAGDIQIPELGVEVAHWDAPGASERSLVGRGPAVPVCRARSTGVASSGRAKGSLAAASNESFRRALYAQPTMPTKTKNEMTVKVLASVEYSSMATSHCAMRARGSAGTRSARPPRS